MSTYSELVDLTKSLGIEGSRVTISVTAQQNLEREGRADKKPASEAEKEKLRTAKEASEAANEAAVAEERRLKAAAKEVAEAEERRIASEERRLHAAKETAEAEERRLQAAQANQSAMLEKQAELDKVGKQGV